MRLSIASSVSWPSVELIVLSPDCWSDMNLIVEVVKIKRGPKDDLNLNL